MAVHALAVVGSGAVVGDAVEIGPFAVVGSDVVLGDGVVGTGHASVLDGTRLGPGCVVHRFARIGRLAMIGGGAPVRQDVPPFTMAAGSDRAQAYGLNRVGLMRASLGAEARRELKLAFRILCRSGPNTRNAVARIRAELACVPETLGLLAFIEGSRRGLCPGAWRLAHGPAPTADAGAAERDA